MSAWARPGVKCVCIYDGPFWWDIDAQSHEHNDFADGRVLTIVATRWDNELGELTISLWGTTLEEWYGVSNFRPLITRTQSEDVALIKSLLVGNEVSA